MDTYVSDDGLTRRESPSDYRTDYDDIAGLYVALGSLSMAACLVLVILYCREKRLRAHPGEMVFFIALCDCLFASKFLIGGMYYWR